jgi:hypothetical protein
MGWNNSEVYGFLVAFGAGLAFMELPFIGALVAIAFGDALAPFIGALVAAGLADAIASVFWSNGFLVAFGAGLAFMELPFIGALVAIAFGDALAPFIGALVAAGLADDIVSATAGTVIRNAAASIDAIIFFICTPPFGATVWTSRGRKAARNLRYAVVT